MSTRQVGLLVLLIGSALFSCKAILIKLAYQHEVSSIALLGLRYSAALPIFLAVGLWRIKRDAGGASSFAALTRAEWIAVLSVGLAGYYLASYTDFLGLRYVTAGMERVILYAYPTMVLLLQRWLFKVPIHRVQWLAVLVSYVGVGIAFADGDWSAGSNFPLGAGLILLSAFLYSAYVIGGGQLTPKLGSVRFTTVALVAACCAVLLHVFVAGEQMRGLDKEVYVYGALMGVFCTAIPAYLVTEGIRRVGAGDAAIIGSIGPAVTILLEYYVLNEVLSLQEALGALLIVIGVVLIGLRKTKANSTVKASN